jgi:hypothetical protein
MMKSGTPNYVKEILMLVFAGLVLYGCGGKEDDFTELPPAQQSPQIQISTTPVQQASTRGYKYKGDRFRDPFIPLTGNGIMITTSDDIQIPNIGSLTLKGILDDGKHKMAIINGGGLTYFLKDSKLYDSKSRLINGISGAIKKESVLMIAPDKSTKELFLRVKE